MDKNATPRPPVSVMIGRQLDQEKIDVLSKRVEVEWNSAANFLL
jgi:hypothetical protein